MRIIALLEVKGANAGKLDVIFITPPAHSYPLPASFLVSGEPVEPQATFSCMPCVAGAPKHRTNTHIGTLNTARGNHLNS